MYKSARPAASYVQPRSTTMDWTSQPPAVSLQLDRLTAKLLQITPKCDRLIISFPFLKETNIHNNKDQSSAFQVPRRTPAIHWILINALYAAGNTSCMNTESEILAANTDILSHNRSFHFAVC